MIPVAKPSISKLENRFVRKAVKSSWIGSKGYYLEAATETFSEVSGTQHVSLVSNGTVAIHLALLALDITEGDEVIVPNFTYVAVANSVRYCGATPKFCEVDPISWNIDTTKLKDLISINTKAIIVVNTFGRIADFVAIRKILKDSHRDDIKIIEDASQSHMAELDNRLSGSFGDISTFSFFANKIITSGEGGAVCSDKEEYISKVNFLKNQALKPNHENYFYFPNVGFNYRLNNLSAAILYAQITRRHELQSSRCAIYEKYMNELDKCELVTLQSKQITSNIAPWLFPVKLNFSAPVSRNEIINKMNNLGIETRPFFHPLNQLPAFKVANEQKKGGVSEELARYGINLPTYVGLKSHEIKLIANNLIKLIT
jgi:perosamine synthetase